MPFERFDNIRRGYTKGGARTFATLTGNNERPVLLIGAYLRDAGFDPDKRYALYLDRDTLTIKLEPDPVAGFKVQRKANRNDSHIAMCIGARGFCNNFGIRERWECLTFDNDGPDIWILRMRPAISPIGEAPKATRNDPKNNNGI